MAFAAGVLYLSGQALAATEEDRRGCASEHNADIRIGACTRVIEDKTTAPAVRTMAFRDRGVAYANKGLQELAIADFDEALKADAKDPAALSGRGKAYQARGQYDRAIADFSALVRLLPGSERAHNDRGLAYLHKGELGPALADFERAIAINTTYVGARNNRAVVLARQGKPDLAIAGAVSVYVLLGKGDGTFTAANGSPLHLPSPPYDDFPSPITGVRIWSSFMP